MTSLEEVNRKWSQSLSEKWNSPLVFGEGPVHTRVMLIGEAPGEQEELQRRPFVGKAGKNLEAFLNGIQLGRDEIYISNTVKIRPFKVGPSGRKSNRPPTREETEAFLPWLREEIDAVSPEVIVTLGNTPLQALLGRTCTVGALHGRLSRYGEKPLFALYHPASIIYNPSLKDTYWDDIHALSQLLRKEVLA